MKSYVAIIIAFNSQFKVEAVAYERWASDMFNYEEEIERIKDCIARRCYDDETYKLGRDFFSKLVKDNGCNIQIGEFVELGQYEG